MLPASSHAHVEDKLFQAAFIYNFIKFTTWPAAKWQAKAPDIILCTIGDDELTHHLEELDGRNIRSRNLITKDVTSEESKDCYLLYIAYSEIKNYRDIIYELGDSPVLTVASFDNFAINGGMIELQREDGQTRLNININSIRSSGLELSSRLLILANVINQTNEP